MSGLTLSEFFNERVAFLNAILVNVFRQMDGSAVEELVLNGLCIHDNEYKIFSQSPVVHGRCTSSDDCIEYRSKNDAVFFLTERTYGVHLLCVATKVGDSDYILDIEEVNNCGDGIMKLLDKEDAYELGKMVEYTKLLVKDAGVLNDNSTDTLIKKFIETLYVTSVNVTCKAREDNGIIVKRRDIEDEIAQKMKSAFLAFSG
jgi:hypothetical protein